MVGGEGVRAPVALGDDDDAVEPELLDGRIERADEVALRNRLGEREVRDADVVLNAVVQHVLQAEQRVAEAHALAEAADLHTDDVGFRGDAHEALVAVGAVACGHTGHVRAVTGLVLLPIADDRVRHEDAAAEVGDGTVLDAAVDDRDADARALDAVVPDVGGTDDGGEERREVAVVVAVGVSGRLGAVERPAVTLEQALLGLLGVTRCRRGLALGLLLFRPGQPSRGLGEGRLCFQSGLLGLRSAALEDLQVLCGRRGRIGLGLHERVGGDVDGLGKRGDRRELCVRHRFEVARDRGEVVAEVGLLDRGVQANATHQRVAGQRLDGVNRNVRLEGGDDAVLLRDDTAGSADGFRGSDGIAR